MTVHPALVLLGAAPIVALVRGRARPAVILVATAGALAAVLSLPAGNLWTVDLAGQRLALLRVDALSQLFGLVFAGITLIGSIYALHVGRGGEDAATLAYAGGALGVVYAGDWLTTFAGWELMGIASLVIVWFGGSVRARLAGFRYIYVHLTGGSMLFAGIALRWSGGADLTMGPLSSDGGLAYGLMLAGVLVNAALPPLHAWLTDAYPEASVTGMVFLSAFTTKTAVYLLIRVFPGAEALAWAGAIMAVYGAVFAVLENDIRRLLAYHIVSQVGYMVAGVGLGTAMALNGSSAHAFSHILYKALLLMAAGAVLQATGKRKLTELGGLGRKMPVVTGLYLVGACSISGVPLFNGFISKSMILSAASEHGQPGIEFLLTLAAIGTFLHTGLKLPYFMFFGTDRGLQPVRLPRNMLVAMAIAAAACLATGVMPSWLYARLPLPPVDYAPYTADHVLSTLQLLVGTGAAFWLMRAKLGGAPTITLDTDRLWRRPIWWAVQGLVGAAATLGHRWQLLAAATLDRIVFALESPHALAMPAASAYDADRARLPIGLTVFWITAGLVALTLLIWLVGGA